MTIEPGRVDAAETTVLDPRIISAIDRTEYRRIIGPEDLADVGALRRDAFNARDDYITKFDQPLIEALDLADETYLFGLYYEARLVASTRLNLLTQDSEATPALDVCPKQIAPLLAQGMTFIDSSRFVVDHAAAREIPALTLLLYRLVVIMRAYFDADYCVGVVKASHESFFRRAFRATHLAGPFPIDGMRPKSILMAIPRSNHAYVLQRNPVLHYTETEARLLFGGIADALPPLSVLPTAHYALRAA